MGDSGIFLNKGCENMTRKEPIIQRKKKPSKSESTITKPKSQNNKQMEGEEKELNNIPEVVVKSDFDGSFKNFVNELIRKKKKPFHHKKIVITSGPYRLNYAVQYMHKSCKIRDKHDELLPEDKQTHNELHLDFYSVSRKRGSELGLTKTEIKALIEVL